MQGLKARLKDPKRWARSINMIFVIFVIQECKKWGLDTWQCIAIWLAFAIVYGLCTYENS